MLLMLFSVAILRRGFYREYGRILIVLFIVLPYKVDNLQRKFSLCRDFPRLPLPRLSDWFILTRGRAGVFESKSHT